MSSHALDTISNGGEGLPFNLGAATNQLTPSLGPDNLNYSNADYDIRNNLVGDAVYEEAFKSSNGILDGLAGGWVLGVKTYYRGGEPFSITNGSVLGSFHTAGTTLEAQLLPGIGRSSIINQTSSNPHSCIYSDCLDTAANVTTGNLAAQFVSAASQDTFGNLRRNSVYGPHYADTDFSILKKVVKAEGFTVQIGVNAYNLFNQANFANPVTDVSSAAFGQIQGAVSPPTSPYGSFQGAAVTQRLLQLHGKIPF